MARKKVKMDNTMVGVDLAKHINDRRTGQADQQTQLGNEWLS
jgi:hypothetical protein